MTHINRKIMISIIILLGIFIECSIVTADPTIDQITTDPASPTHQSTINITAKISGDGITSVKVTVSECNDVDGICYFNTPYTMTKNGEGDWVAQATLKDTGKSNYIKYTFDVTDSERTHALSDSSWRVDISTQNGGDNSQNNNKSPGFEIIILLVAVIIGILIVGILKIKRKRL